MFELNGLIRWVWVRTDVARVLPAEFELALADLRRQLGSAQWHFGAEPAPWLAAEASTNADDKMVLLAHPWVTLEARCLERLALGLQQGFDRVLACDSSHPAPMPPVDYATFRGMERYVDGAGEMACVPMEQDAAALVELSTVGGLRKAHPRVARIRGAFAHDVSGYFGGDRAEVLALIAPDAQRFMDVGGGQGRFLEAVKEMRPGAWTQLVELDGAAAQQARQHGRADAVWNGDFLNFAAQAPDEKFDCISFLDVLEHVTEPEAYLRRAKALLSESGAVVASIPNVGHWSVVADLLEGRWDYVPVGIHCITHVRFFTEQTVRDLMARAGLAVARIEPVTLPANAQWLAQWGVACEAMGLKMDRTSLDTYAFLIVAS